MSDLSNSPSTISSYIQKAMTRKNPSQHAVSSSVQFEAKPKNSNDFEKLTATLLNSFQQNETPIFENTGQFTREFNNENFTLSKDDFSCENNGNLVKEILNKNPEIDPKISISLRKTELIRATNQISLKTIKSLISTINPPQSIVNIVLAYVSVLVKFDKTSKLLKIKPKTYENCIKIIENSDLAYKITYETAKICDIFEKDDRQKLLKIKGKYLAGWDMRPSAFSDRYYAARTILQYLINLCDCASENTIKNSPKQQNIKKNPDSPTRLLIEHKCVKIRENNDKNKIQNPKSRAKTPRLVKTYYQTQRPNKNEINSKRNEKKWNY